MQNKKDGMARNVDLDQAARYKLKIALHFLLKCICLKYIRTSMARTPLEPGKYVRVRGTSS